MGKQFAGTERFEIRRHLGEGGMGVVYEAFDRERQKTVALKTLSRIDAAGIYGLKREFRSLADVIHPNLVGLHDLVSADNDWFFTMELVAGVDFLQYIEDAPTVREVARPGEATGMMTQPSPGVSVPPNTALDVTLAAPSTQPHLRSTLDLDRLRAATSQLAEAIHAIHAAGKLHRDLKPTNVLVTATGRVVVLDFGLVQERDAPETDQGEEALIVGTPAYMAPEQAGGERATAASDWYALGVMLFQALTGRPPFVGSVREVLGAKQHLDAPAPSQLVRGVPADLDQLTHALLQRDPALRPGYGDIVARLRLGSVTVVPSLARPAPAPTATQTSFFGRRLELRALGDALTDTRRGRPVMMYVHGPAGMGKSAILERFVESLRKEDIAVVLSGRCYQRESVPYKAFDAAIDALSRYLRRLPTGEVTALLPRNTRDLARLFPVLERVEAIQRAPHCGVTDETDDLALRTRAFSALKDLLGRIADRRPLVLHVDDLHWGDADSAELLVSLLTPPLPPALLFVGSYRDEWVDDSPMLTRLTEGETPDVVAERRHLEVGPLDRDASLGMALELLDDRAPDAWTVGKAIAREANGNPFHVAELSTYLGALWEHDDNVDPNIALQTTLEQALAARVRLLRPAEQDLLTVLAVAGTPIDQAVAARIGRVAEDLRLTVGALIEQHLVRTSRREGHDVVELIHEPLREVLLARLDESTTRDLHRRLARELEASGHADPATLARHFAEAGHRESAAEQAALAGKRAVAALAFARAAHFYENALLLGSSDDPERWRLLAHLAEALARAGRPGEAIGHLLEAARSAPTIESVRLTRRAAELRLREARVDGLTQGASPQRYSLFDEIDRPEVQSLLADSDIVEGQAGDKLLEPTRAANCFYFILSGSVEVRRQRGSGARIPEGSLLGEVPFLLGGERVVEVIASENDTRLLALSQRSLESLTESNPRLALQLVLNLSRIVCSKAVGVQERVFATVK